MISRRELLIAATKAGSLAACSRIVPITALNAGTFTPAALADNLVATAPRARYWISAASSGSQCGKCHKPGKSLKDKEPKGHSNAVRCLLCAQELHSYGRGKGKMPGQDECQW